MDVKDKLTMEEKAAFENLRVELMVLNNVVEQKKAVLRAHLADVLQRLGYNPQTYGLNFNAAKDEWEIKLRPDALALPNRQQRRHPVS